MVDKKFILFIFIVIILIIIILQLKCKKEKKSFHELLYPKDYEINFNENKYRKNINKNYKKIIKDGLKIMKTKKLVVGALFKDSSEVFEKFRKRMDNLKKYFKDVQIVIFENDSKDNSRILLLNWEIEDDKFHTIKCKENNFCLLKKSAAISHGTFSTNRMKKMCEYRNYIKKYIDQFYSDFDYFMMIDSDAKGGFSIEGLAYSFGKTLDWDMISAYGSTGVVLTAGQLIYHDYIAYLDNFNTFKELKDAININLTDTTDLIPVDHAFGGLSIYKMSSIKDVDYTPKDGKYICEHTIFTNNMKLKGFNKFFINPNLIFLMGKQGADILPFY